MAHRSLDLASLPAGRLRSAGWRRARLAAGSGRGCASGCWRSASAGCCGCRSAIGTGVACYFALPGEPPLWLGAAGVAADRGGAGLALAVPAGRAVPALAAGPARPRRAAGGLHRRDRCAPIWSRRRCWSGAPPIVLEATVLLVEDRLRGQRVLLGEAADRGARAGRDAGPAPGQHARRRAALVAGRSDPGAGAADAALAAGRAARLRLRPPGLFRAARRGRLCAGRAADARPRRAPRLVARHRGAAPDDRARDRRGGAGAGRRDRGGAAGRAARRAAGRDLGRLGGRRHHPSAVDLRPASGAGGRNAVLLGPDRARARAAARACACRRRSWPRCSR